MQAIFKIKKIITASNPRSRAKKQQRDLPKLAAMLSPKIATVKMGGLILNVLPTSIRHAGFSYEKQPKKTTLFLLFAH